MHSGKFEKWRSFLTHDLVYFDLKLTLTINSLFPFSIHALQLLLESHHPNWKFFAKVHQFSKFFFVLNSRIIKPEQEVLSKMCCFYLWVFKIYLKNSNLQPISFKDLNINLVSWNGFSKTSAKDWITILLQINNFWKTAFDHVTYLM